MRALKPLFVMLDEDLDILSDLRTDVDIRVLGPSEKLPISLSPEDCSLELSIVSFTRFCVLMHVFEHYLRLMDMISGVLDQRQGTLALNAWLVVLPVVACVVLVCFAVHLRRFGDI